MWPAPHLPRESAKVLRILLVSSHRNHKVSFILNIGVCLHSSCLKWVELSVPHPIGNHGLVLASLQRVDLRLAAILVGSPPAWRRGSTTQTSLDVCVSTATTSHCSSLISNKEEDYYCLVDHIYHLVNIFTANSPGLPSTPVKKHNLLIILPESHVTVSIPSLLIKLLRTVKSRRIQSPCKLPR